jgi:hypothetical protein
MHFSRASIRVPFLFGGGMDKHLRRWALRLGMALVRYGWARAPMYRFKEFEVGETGPELVMPVDWQNSRRRFKAN